MRSKEIYIKSYLGIGDNIYQRPFVKKLAEKYDTVFIETPVPQLYVDCGYNIRFVKSDAVFSSMKLRTQQKLRDIMPEVLWVPKPENIEEMEFLYHTPNSAGVSTKTGYSIIECFSQQVPNANLPDDFKIDVRDSWRGQARCILESHPNFNKNRPICVIKPPTIRGEWAVPNRNPKIEYMYMLLDNLPKEYQVVSIADVEDDKEWFDFEHDALWPYVGMDVETCNFHKGEFNMRQVMGLVDIADVVICPVCFMVPLCAAVGTKTFCVFGGYMHPDLILDERMGLDDFMFAAPENWCEHRATGTRMGCFDAQCSKCDRDIDVDKMVCSFETLLTGRSTRRSAEPENVLLARIIPEWMDKIGRNDYLTDRHKLHVMSNQVDDIIDTSLFETVHTVEESRKDIERILADNDIHIAVISQQLFHRSENIAEACKNLSIPVVWTERFFDNKRVFDATGLQFMPENEITQYIDEVHYTGDIDIPESTREPQAGELTKEQFFKKYGLKQDAMYIVMLGQTTFDMSLINSMNPKMKTFEDYARTIFEKNSGVTFIYKNHPLYYSAHARRRNEDVGFVHGYKNVIEVVENIQTLFNAFDYFTAFSSTTILEGLMQRKQFASPGYHFCTHPKLVLQIKTNEIASNLYERLQGFQPDEDLRKKYLEFVCNYLCVDVTSEDLVKRIDLRADKFYDYMSEKYKD